MTTKQTFKTAWQTASNTKPENVVQSSLFVKKLVAMSISHIVYLRGLLPEEAFMDREMDGVPVKIIYEKTKFAPAVQIVEWLKGAFEAFDKKYLQKLEFIFFSDEEKEQIILESYSFCFSYGDDGVSVTCESEGKSTEMSKKFKLEEIRFATVQLLRHTTMLMQNMRKVSENLSMKVRLYYYEDVTPEEYEPPGYEKAADSEYLFEPLNIKFRHGTVDTGFHSVKLTSKIGMSRIREEQELTTEVRDIVNSVQKKQQNKKCAETDACTTEKSPRTTEKEHTESHLEVEAANLNLMTPVIATQNDKVSSQAETCAYIRETPTDVQNASVNCACGVPEDEGLLVFCEVCRCWNHAVCYRFLDEKSIPQTFCCIYCHDKAPNLKCNDDSLISLSEKDQKMICLYRRALVFCISSWRVDQRILASELSVNPNIADQLLSWMENDMVFSNKKRKGKGYYHINTEYLKETVIPAYFEKALVPKDGKLPSIPQTCVNETQKEEEDPKLKLRRINQSVKSTIFITKK